MTMRSVGSASRSTPRTERFGCIVTPSPRRQAHCLHPTCNARHRENNNARPRLAYLSPFQAVESGDVDFLRDAMSSLRRIAATAHRSRTASTRRASFFQSAGLTRGDARAGSMRSSSSASTTTTGCEVLRPQPVHDWASHAADAFCCPAGTLDRKVVVSGFHRRIEYSRQGVV
jgi:hypothetical protein